jgi:DNA-binding NtrC family response regulator
VGGNKTIEADVRLVAATNRNLEALVRDGKFREDLFFRIRVVQITLPPLRERPEDIPILANHFCREYAKENAKGEMRLSTGAMEALGGYRWPGNVRELRTAVEHGVVLARGQEIETRDLPASVREGGDRTGSGVRPGGHTVKLEELERHAIETALRKTKQNVTEAAKLLGISRRTLHRKLADAKKG